MYTDYKCRKQFSNISPINNFFYSVTIKTALVNKKKVALHVAPDEARYGQNCVVIKNYCVTV